MKLLMAWCSNSHLLYVRTLASHIWSRDNHAAITVYLQRNQNTISALIYHHNSTTRAAENPLSSLANKVLTMIVFRSM